MSSVTVRTAAALFLEAAAADVAPATLALYRLYVRRFELEHGELELDQVTPAVVRKWGKSYHPVQAVQRLLSWSHREARIIHVNPLEGMRKMPRGRRLRTLTPAELLRIERLAQPALRRFVVALAESFARPHELRLVTWHQVRIAGLLPAEDEDMTAGRAFLFLERFKGQWRRRDASAIRVIPISRRLGRLLARLRRRQPEKDRAVFLNHRGGPWTVNAVRCAFRRLRRRAGLVADERGENVVAYSLRHSGATAAIVAGVPIADLAGALGHSDIRMTNRYVHLSPAFLASVVERMEQAKRASRRKNGRTRSLRVDPDDVG